MERTAMFLGIRTTSRMLCGLGLLTTLGCNGAVQKDSADVMPPEARDVLLGMSRNQIAGRENVHDNSGDLSERVGSAVLLFWFGDQIRGYDGGKGLAAVVVSYASDNAHSRLTDLAARWTQVAGPPVQSATKSFEMIGGIRVPTRIVVWRHKGMQLAIHEELGADSGAIPPVRRSNVIVAKAEVPLASLFSAFGDVANR